MRSAVPFVLGAFVASCLGPPAVAPVQTLSAGLGAAQGRSRGPFAVVFAGPRGTVEDRAEPGVTVLFNRAMRTIEDEQAPVPRLIVRTEGGADVAGGWRWVGTHGLLFTPDGDLAGGTRFRVTVPRGTRGLEGDALQDDYSFSFETPRPRLVASVPAEGQATLRGTTELRLEFNQAIDPAALASVAHLRVRAGDAAGEREIQLSAHHPVALSATAGGSPDPERVLLVTPAEPWPRDAAVEMVIDRGLRGEGPLALDEPERLHVRTVGPLRLAKVLCPRVFDTTLGPCQAHRDITVVLNNQVMPDEFRSHLALGRLPKARAAQAAPRDPKAKAGPPRPELSFALGADPESARRYRVTLKAGMTDIYGQRLDRDVAFDVDTEPPFGKAPAAAPNAPAPQPAPAPIPSGSARAIPPFEVGFGIDGYVLEASRGPHTVPVGLVNVPTYGLVTRRLDERETKQWLAGIASSPQGFLAGGYRFAWETPDPAANTRVVRSVDLDALLSPVGRGTALLALGTPAGESAVRQQLVSVTDLGVTAKMSKFGSLVWVTSLSTGKPVPGAEVSVGLAKSEASTTWRTDDHGLAVVPAEAFSPVVETHGMWSRDASPDGQAILVVRSGNDWTYQRVEESPTFARAAPHPDLAGSSGWQGTVFADRGIYRPGETVKLAAVLRQADARRLVVAPGKEVRVSLTDARGESLFESRAKLDAFGGLAVDAPLPKTAHLGPVTATLRMPESQTTLSTRVLLADFKPAEFAVTARADRDQLVRGDRVHFAVHGEYLFHAPMAGAAAHDTAVRSVTSFTPRGAADYITDDETFTSDYGDTNPRAGELLEQDAVLDDQGNLDASVELAMPGQTRPELVSFESDVEDFTRQVVAGSASVLVHPAELYVGIARPPSRFVAVGAALSPRVLALAPDGAHVAGAEVNLELVERTWTTVVQDGANAARRSEVVDTPLASCRVTTGAEPVSCALRVPRAGYFVLRATARDRRGNVVRASTGLYALSDRPDEAPPRLGWHESDARVVHLESDRPTYAPGETAKVLVKNPFQEAEALVTVERGGIMASYTTTLRGPMPVVSIPIEDDYFPNVFVSVHLVRGRIRPAPASGPDLSGPDYREGFVELGVSPQTHRLDVQVTPDRKEHKPDDEVDAEVVVRDAHGAPTRAEVTFYAVDEGVLILTDYKTPDPLAAFTGPRALAVFGLDNRDHLARILALKGGEQLSNVGWEQPGEDKGDVGGDGSSGGRVRRDFRNTAYFEAGRVTTDDGKARFHFKLPDSLTTYRLMAVAAGVDRFGSGDAHVTASKALMVRPALPRAVRVGDRFDASVVVSGKHAGAVDVHLALGGGALALAEGSASRRLTLPPTGNAEVHFPVVARAPGDATLRFAATGGGESDSLEVTRTVALPVHLETVAVYGETRQSAAIALGDLSKVRPDQGGLKVNLSSSALVGLDSAFDELDRYPYGCTEQLASRMIPLVALDDLAREVGARVPAATDARLQDAVGQMLAHQHDGGGFGYWNDDAPVPWLSAYAMFALDAAARKNVPVPASALDAGAEYLRRTLARERFVPPEGDEDAGPSPSGDDESSRQGSGDDDRGAAADEGLAAGDRAARAYAEATFLADALATVGKPDPGTLNRLYDARADKPLFTQALLLHAMAAAAMPRAQVDTLAAEVVARLRVDADRAVADEQSALCAPLLDSAARTTALVLRALLAADPRQPLAPRLARGLLAARRTDAWASTQEDAWALLALDDYRKAQETAKPDFDVDVFLGRERVGSTAFHQPSLRGEELTLSPARVRELGGPLSFALRGAGPLFYSAALEYAAVDLPSKPVDRGLFVQKTMHAVKVGDLARATQWIPKKTSLEAHAGDLVVVDVLLESAEPEEQVVVADPLPAGLEAVDFDLATTGRLHEVGPAVRTDTKPPPDALGGMGLAFRQAPMHRELRDDRVLTFLPHLEPGLYHFRYLARATVAGTFVVPPTSAECMYSPEVYGRTRAESFDVRP